MTNHLRNHLQQVVQILQAVWPWCLWVFGEVWQRPTFPWSPATPCLDCASFWRTARREAGSGSFVFFGCENFQLGIGTSLFVNSGKSRSPALKPATAVQELIVSRGQFAGPSCSSAGSLAGDDMRKATLVPRQSIAQLSEPSNPKKV